MQTSLTLDSSASQPKDKFWYGSSWPLFGLGLLVAIIDISLLITIAFTNLLIPVSLLGLLVTEIAIVYSWVICAAAGVHYIMERWELNPNLERGIFVGKL